MRRQRIDYSMYNRGYLKFGVEKAGCLVCNVALERIRQAGRVIDVNAFDPALFVSAPTAAALCVNVEYVYWCFYCLTSNRRWIRTSELSKMIQL